MAPLILGYWGVRGLGAHIRYLLEYEGQDYEYKNWTNAPEPGWFSEKENIGLKFPNLPYLIDGSIKLSQSGAIMKYLGRKFHLIARGESELQEQEMLDGVLYDLRIGVGIMCYQNSGEQLEVEKKKYRTERLDATLKQLEEQLEGQIYLLGHKLTYNDFILFELLELLDKLYGEELFGQLPNLKTFRHTIANLKGVKEFLASGKNFPKFFGPTAKWGQ